MPTPSRLEIRKIIDTGVAGIVVSISALSTIYAACKTIDLFAAMERDTQRGIVDAHTWEVFALAAIGSILTFAAAKTVAPVCNELEQKWESLKRTPVYSEIERKCRSLKQIHR